MGQHSSLGHIFVAFLLYPPFYVASLVFARYFKNGAALLELALVQWAAHEAVKRGFQPFIPPDLVRARDPQ